MTTTSDEAPLARNFHMTSTRRTGPANILQRTGWPGSACSCVAALLADETRAAPAANPLAPREPHFKARAKRVIFLFMPGGPSQVDTFDPKPELTKQHGKPSLKLYLGQKRNLLASPWKLSMGSVRPRRVSELFPHVGACADQLCVLRGMVADDVNHPGGCLQMNTGERVATRPSLGSWVTYGLGTENQNLPGFIAIGPGPLIEGGRQYGAAFLPAAHQGTFVSDLTHPISNLKNDQITPERQRQELDAQLNDPLREIGPKTAALLACESRVI